MLTTRQQRVFTTAKRQKKTRSTKRASDICGQGKIGIAVNIWPKSNSQVSIYDISFGHRRLVSAPLTTTPIMVHSKQQRKKYPNKCQSCQNKEVLLFKLPQKPSKTFDGHIFCVRATIFRNKNHCVRCNPGKVLSTTFAASACHWTIFARSLCT